MAENKKFVITVGRQYGSGGAEMAKRLGERLGLHVYDKEILKMTSEESGIRESYFHLADEKAGNKLLYRIIHSLIPENGTPSLGSDLISSDNLFRFQSSVMKTGAGGILHYYRSVRRLCSRRDGKSCPDLRVRRDRGEDQQGP